MGFPILTRNFVPNFIKMKKGFYIALVLILGVMQSFAQTINDFKLLKGEQAVEVVFRYDQLRMMKEEYTEEEYKVVHMANLERKVPGSSEGWLKEWNKAKKELWEPRFISFANKYSKGKVKFSRYAPTSKYIMYVDVTWIYTGWDAGIMNQAGKVSSTLTLVRRDSPAIIMAKHDFDSVKANQSGSNLNNEIRVANGFEKTGKDFGKKIAKSI